MRLLWFTTRSARTCGGRRLANAFELAKGSGGVCFALGTCPVDGALSGLLRRMRRILSPHQRLLVQIGPGVPGGA